MSAQREAVGRGWRGGDLTNMSETSEARHSAPDTAKAATGENATRSPPIAGPTMAAIWLPAELTTIARGISRRSTSVGASAALDGV
jgi:hypothetical protein